MSHARANADSTSSQVPEHVAVERGIAEFRAGRPVLVVAEQSIIAVPVDGLDALRLRLFRGGRSAAPLRLVLTSRRARVLGIEAQGAAAVLLSEREDLDTVLSFAADPVVRGRLDGVAAGPAAIAAINLTKLAELLPALLIAESGQLRNPGALIEVEAAAVISFRQYLAKSVRIAASARVPIEGGAAARVVVFRNAIGGSPSALVVGEPNFGKPVLVRLHSACLTGDVFGSQRCDCGDQLKLAMARMTEASGIILYLEQEGRGLGLANKMRAYELQDLGFDTVDANITLGFEDDERDYQIAARMLALLGCRRVVLLTNNPAKLEGLSRAGIEICGSMPLQAPIKPENRRYLTTKALRAGHRLGHLLTGNPHA
jgi:GTP cyclohydrolase II